LIKRVHEHEKMCVQFFTTWFAKRKYATTMLEPGHQVKAQARKRVLLLVLSVALLASCVGLLALVASSSSSSSSPSSSSTATGTRVKVPVVLYGESLCPDCRHMVLDVIEPILDSGLGAAMDLRYVAYGNVRTENDEGITCQHGKQECLMNRYINCAQVDGVGSSDVAVWFPYVSCLADNLSLLNSKSYMNRASECAAEAGMSASKLTECAEGPKGEALERQAGEETNRLVPKHTFVPWMEVNGAALGSDYDNLDRYVCVGAAADLRPDACATLRDKLMHQD